MRTLTKPAPVIYIAFIYTVVVVVLGYVMLGLVPMMLFACGFVGGFVLWLLGPSTTSFSWLRAPYFAALGLFVVHKLEERHFDFFPALAEITGVPNPSENSPLVFALYGMAGCWLLIPWLINRRSEFGYFLAWTFFTSLGIIELAHFGFPLMRDSPYGYFPGMVSVVPLAPVAWWGMWRLARRAPPAE